MSKLSHSNPNLNDVLNEKNKHKALKFKASQSRIDFGPRGEAAQDAFDREFNEFLEDSFGGDDNY